MSLAIFHLGLCGQIQSHLAEPLSLLEPWDRMEWPHSNMTVEGCFTVSHPGNLWKVAGGRAEAKTPFLSRISLLTGHSKAEAMCWGCAGTSSQPQALVTPKGSHGDKINGTSLGPQLSQGPQDSSSFRNTSPANSHFARHCY